MLASIRICEFFALYTKLLRRLLVPTIALGDLVCIRAKASLLRLE